MLGNPIARFFRNRLDELINVITIEENSSAALVAQQEMLMTFASGDERLTAFGLMNALNQTELFELFKRSIDSNGSSAGYKSRSHRILRQG